MGALASQADEPSTAPETAPEAAPTSGPLMKRIRMKRQIVVDGQVVREEIVEKLVPVDTDTTSMVAEMDTELGHASKEEIAHMANLDPDTSLDLRQRTDMPLRARIDLSWPSASLPASGRDWGRGQSAETTSSPSHVSSRSDETTSPSGSWRWRRPGARKRIDQHEDGANRLPQRKEQEDRLIGLQTGERI